MLRFWLDRNRDEIIDDKDLSAKKGWGFGEHEVGAIVLANVLPNNPLPDQGDNKLFTKIKIKNSGSDDISAILAVNKEDTRFFNLYGKKKVANANYEVLLGKDKFSNVVFRLKDYEDIFYLEALDFPNPYFDGILNFYLGVDRPDGISWEDELIIRVSPLMFLPNTQKPIKVYLIDNDFTKQFIASLRPILTSLKIEFEIIQSNDLWIQDIFQFGYSARPGKTLFSILESPRDSGMDRRVIGRMKTEEMLGHRILRGIVQRKKNSLASFGNLEVSPPSSMYPFGRILLGGRALNKPEESGHISPHQLRGMNKEVVRFLQAQKIQPPLHLVTDWLSVGHVDEILTFVPTKKIVETKVEKLPETEDELIKKRLTKDLKSEFKYLVLMADTCITKEILRDEVIDKNQKVFQNKDLKVAEYLDLKNELNRKNVAYQNQLNENKELLTNDLCILEDQIIRVPSLFVPEDDLTGGAVSYFPNMVNCLVLGSHIVMTKPLGPKNADGECVFENSIIEQLKQHEINKCDVSFIEDNSFFREYGGFHCAANIKRKEFCDKWWNTNDSFSTANWGQIPKSLLGEWIEKLKGIYNNKK